MAVTKFFKILLLVQCMLWKIHEVSDELDEATRERMWLREFSQNRKMTRVLQELEQGRQQLEQRTQEQSSFAWGDLLFGALQQWQFWTVAGVLDLLFGLCWWLRKRSRQPASSSKEAGSGKKAEKEEQKAVDPGSKWAKRFKELDELFPTAEEFIWIFQKCKANYPPMTEASYYYKQHLRRSEFP